MDRSSSDFRPGIAGRNVEAVPPIRNWMDARLDFPQPTPMLRSYIVASSYRSGSTYFCSELWRTGVLGAPAEYLNIGQGRMLRDAMAARLQARTSDAYFARLLACRTSRSGIFGLKAHFHHFEAALDWCPRMLEILSPVIYIYLNRRDKLAQAISFAKALQTDVWTAMDEAVEAAPRYDEALIERCMDELSRQRFGWLRWFETHDIVPIVVNYEDFLADRTKIVENLLTVFEVRDAPAETVFPPAITRLGDATNDAWAARFRAAHDTPFV